MDEYEEEIKQNKLFQADIPSTASRGIIRVLLVLLGYY